MHMATGQLFLLALVLRGFRLRLLLDPAESDHSDAGGIWDVWDDRNAQQTATNHGNNLKAAAIQSSSMQDPGGLV